MIYLKVKGSGSWLDSRSRRGLAAALAERLWNRCAGHKGLFVTLTYRRDEYRDAVDLYRCASEQQHVAMFLRKVSRGIGESLKGRWFCKLEFQRGGWLHWHLIILDVGRISHAQLTSWWGKGHVWVKKLSEQNVRYCCKYLSKGGGLPAWLYGERPRSVKVVRVSPGFWGQAEPKPQRPEQAQGPRPVRLPFYVPIGQRIEDSGGSITVQDDEGRFLTAKGDFGGVLAALLLRGHGIGHSEHGWVSVDATLADLDASLAWSERIGWGRRDSFAGSPSLHLNKRRNPDRDRAEWPGWLRSIVEEMCGCAQ